MKYPFFISIVIASSIQSFAQNKSNVDSCIRRAYSKTSDIQKAQGQIRECLYGQEFPSFSVQTINNQKITKESLKGNVVLLNFWFIACSPCREEMPILEEINNSYGGMNFILLTFATDNKESVQAFFKENKISLETIASSKSLMHDLLGIYSCPVTFLLNKKSEIVFYKEGGLLDQEQLGKLIELESKK